MMYLLDTTKITVLVVGLVALLPLVCALLAKVSGNFQKSDNANPRDFLARASGRAARLNAAQKNSFEGLPLFFVAVVLGLHTFVPLSIINYFALFYLICRVLYIVAYAKNWATFRSVIWFLGLMSCLMLLYLSWRLGV